MTEKLYHIFKVYDYKGGELSTDTNLTREQLIDSLVNMLPFYDYIEGAYEDRNDEDEERELDFEFIKKILKSNSIYTEFDFSSAEYAGGGDLVWEVYECENNVMIPFEITKEILDECIDLYLKNQEK